MADVTIKYKGANIATMDASGTKTLETSGKYCEGDVQVVYADPEKPTQSKSATPSLSAQTISPDSGKVLSSVSVAAITKELLASLDTDFVAENIKKDVDLFGLIGTLAGGGGGDAVTGSFTGESNTYHDFRFNETNLGFTPDVFIMYPSEYPNTVSSRTSAAVQFLNYSFRITANQTTENNISAYKTIVANFNGSAVYDSVLYKSGGNYRVGASYKVNGNAIPMSFDPSITYFYAFAKLFS